MTAQTPAAPRRPARQVCPLCGHDDDVTMANLPGPLGWWWFHCEGGGKQHTGPYEWAVESEPLSPRHEGICAELGLYEDLPKCVVANEPWVEHGIVECRYALLRPDVYSHLIDIYGHIAIEPKRYTASVLLASALAQLSRKGVIAASATPLRATGFWSYNRTVTYWAAMPSSAGDGVQTWHSYAQAHNLDPTVWVLPSTESPRGRAQ
jgi:hypothetical protein